MDTPDDTWKVDVDGSIYEADAETLQQWIYDGYVTPATRVQKGSLAWIELGRAPAFRNLFQSAPPAGAVAYAQPAPPVAAGVCVNHPYAAAKYVCQDCGASLCIPCVKRYGNAAVCTLCGQLCRPFAVAAVESKRQNELSSGFGLADLWLAVQYPLKDPIALAVTAGLYGFLLMFGIYGRLAAAGLLFGYISHAIRRVSMGHYDEGPSPDLSDPADLVFGAGKLGIAITLVTLGPLVAILLFGVSAIDGVDATQIASLGVGAIVGLVWAAFYYPMALLVAGYTGEFLPTVNPIVGIATMGRLGLDYAKAYAMCVCIFIFQALVGMTVSIVGAASEHLFDSALVQALAYFVQYVVQGAVAFYASMVVAAVLGLVLFKRPDVVDVDV